MDKERILSAMDYVDAGLVEEADVAATKTHKAWKKPALIAACLCLALAGAALAAESVKKMTVSEPVRLGSPDESGGGKYYTFFEVKDGIAYISLDLLSDEVWEMIGEEEWGMPLFKGFDSWSEAERFIGLEFADNAVLEQGIAVPHMGMTQYGKGKKAVGNSVLELSGSLKAPTFLELTAHYYIDPTGEYAADILFDTDPDGDVVIHTPISEYSQYASIWVDALIGTEAALMKERGTPQSFGAKVTDIAVETYTTAGGIEATIATYPIAFYKSSCIAVFSLNGARFTIYSGNDGQQLAMDALKLVLDGFK